MVHSHLNWIDKILILFVLFICCVVRDTCGDTRGARLNAVTKSKHKKSALYATSCADF